MVTHNKASAPLAARTTTLSRVVAAETNAAWPPRKDNGRRWATNSVTKETQQ
jgi:hypothetical protein